MELRRYGWILQGLLAIIFLFLVIQTLTLPIEELAQKRGITWINSVSIGWLRLIDVMEILVVVGLFLSIVISPRLVLSFITTSGIIVLMIAGYVPTVNFIHDALTVPQKAIELKEKYEETSPKVGEKAQDFKVWNIEGNNKVCLSDFYGKKPIALVFGSST